MNAVLKYIDKYAIGPKSFVFMHFFSECGSIIPKSQQSFPQTNFFTMLFKATYAKLLKIKIYKKYANKQRLRMIATVIYVISNYFTRVEKKTIKSIKMLF